MSERYPYSLIGIDGNAYSVMGYVINAMKQCGYSRDAIQCYRDEAMSNDYDHLLSVSIMMIENCNKASGFEEGQQLMKGHDGLEYVGYPHSGVQNRRENLINEDFDPFDPFGLSYDDESNLDFENSSDEDDEYYDGDDYKQLYNSISSAIKFVLNNHIAYKNNFTKADVKQSLMSILDNKDFWNYLDQEIPEKRLNESSLIHILQYDIESQLIHKFDDLLKENVKFSKYDVKHVFLQLLNSPKFWASLPKYIEEE